MHILCTYGKQEEVKQEPIHGKKRKNLLNVLFILYSIEVSAYSITKNLSAVTGRLLVIEAERKLPFQKFFHQQYPARSLLEQNPGYCRLMYSKQTVAT